ncbi:endonuclease/exonuclease/phosphatase family protein [Streptomyces sp. NPDC002643]
MRVVTWNLWWRFGPWQERQKAILAVLRELRPDVVGLQEVWGRDPEGPDARGRGARERGAEDGENLAGWLAGELGMNWAWGAYGDPERWQRRGGDVKAGVGVAVLSRWPLLESEAIHLPGGEEDAEGEGDEQANGEGNGVRGALYTLLDAPEAPIPFFTTHLSSDTDGSALRCRQVTALAEFIDRHRHRHGQRSGNRLPPLVTGDFNAFPDSDEVRLFGGYKTTPPVPGHCFYDAWEYADPAAPSATWDMTNPYVTRAHGPSARIDYIHVGVPTPYGTKYAVHSVRRAAHAPSNNHPTGVWPSDHAAVVADLEVPGTD